MYIKCEETSCQQHILHAQPRIIRDIYVYIYYDDTAQIARATTNSAGVFVLVSSLVRRHLLQLKLPHVLATRTRAHVSVVNRILNGIMVCACQSLFYVSFIYVPGTRTPRVPAFARVGFAGAAQD